MLRRVSGACGIASQLAGLTAILVAALASPSFGWTENDLSVLGIEGPATAVFNWGLILTGLLSLVFAIGLRRNLLSSRLGEIGTFSLILGSVSLSAVGVFPRSINMPHDSASIAFFVLITLALLLVGAAAVIASQIRWGLLSLIAAALMLAFMLAPWPWTGGAIEQLICCLPWSLWTVILGIRLLAGAQPIDVRGLL